VIGPPEADGQRRVLLAALPLELVERCRSVVASSNLTLSRLGLRPYAVWRAYRQVAVVPQGGVLLINVAGDAIELTVAQGGTVLFSRGTMLKAQPDSSAIEPAALLGEVRRTMAAFSNQVPGVTVERIAVAAGEDQHRAACEQLASALGLPVDRFDPFQGLDVSGAMPDDPGAFAGAIGALVSAQEPWPIDFLNPKRPVVQRDRRKPLALVAAAAAVLLIAGSYALAQMKLSIGRKQIAEKTKLQAKLQQDVKSANEVIRKHQDVARWITSGVDALQELQSISEQYPDTRSMYTTSLTMDRDLAARGSTKIDLDGVAKQTSAIDKFYSTFNSGDRYRARPATGPVQPNTRGGEYRNSFRGHIVLRPEALAESDGEPTTGKAANANSVSKPMRSDPLRKSGRAPSTTSK